MALGADASHLLRMVMARGLLLTLAGMALGAGLALGMGHLLGYLLYHVSHVTPAPSSLHSW
jgi:ABC-type antimicrobial peptide transport system permease subunit